MNRSPVSRVAFVIYSMGGGGAERVAANLANHWAGAGWDITIVTFAPRSLDFYDLHPAITRVALDLVGDSRNPVHGLWRNLRRMRALRHVLRKSRPAVALGLMTGANVLLSIAAYGLPVRVIGSEHVHPPKFPLSPLWERLRKHCYGRLDALAVLTRESAAWFQANTTAHLVAVIPNPAPWPLLGQEPRVSPESVCMAGRKVLLAVGRLVEQKGFDWLLSAFRTVGQRHSQWDLVILGDGPLRAALELQVKSEGLDGRVFLPGHVGNLAEWYERADLYVMSSRYEGFGNTLAEAMAHGLAAVSFDCDTGPRDIIRHEIDGLLVAPGEPASLAAAMDRLMADRDLRHQFAARAMDARDRFSVQWIARRWEELFAQVNK
jgi:glycosyltransferase involved in cell wall biosynthesis